jgi:ElaB/YqjD/DUF883 family membrane-anchored ribosome-binding protein
VLRGYKSAQTFIGDQEAGVAQSQRGPVRTEVSDLRNIVDRLDLLMGSSADASTESAHGIGGSAREQIEEALSELSHRIGVVEREAEELRTLVNHLMTIATWQAKVTATLVGDEEEADEQEPPPLPPHHDPQGAADEPVEEQQLYSPPPPPDQQEFVESGPPTHGADPRSQGFAEHRSANDGADLRSQSFVDRVGQHMETRRHGDEPDRPRRPASTTLDDDIDDILGTDRDPSSEIGPPPDFGI